MLWVETLACKSDALAVFQRSKAKAENESGRVMQQPRCNGDGEYMSNTFHDYLTEPRIIRDSTTPYTPQTNGIAERVNRTLVRGLIAMLSQANAPKSLWVEALQVRTKLDHKALPLVHIGYKGNTATYRLYDPPSSRIMRSQDVRFVEHKFPLTGHADAALGKGPANQTQAANVYTATRLCTICH
ncbi:hypothetical protein JCM8547_000684 [Rhodosporidiobolus lusitaniae]